MDIFGKIIAGILIVFMIFINPLQYLLENENSILSSYVDSLGTEFVNEVCNSGTITLQSYEQLQSNLADTGELYDIELEHSHGIVGSILDTTEEINQSFSLINLSATASSSHVHTADCYTKVVSSNSPVCSGEMRFYRRYGCTPGSYWVGDAYTNAMTYYSGNAASSYYPGYGYNNLSMTCTVYRCTSCGTFLNHVYCLIDNNLVASYVFTSNEIPKETYQWFGETREFSLMDVLSFYLFGDTNYTYYNMSGILYKGVAKKYGAVSSYLTTDYYDLNVCISSIKSFLENKGYIVAELNDTKYADTLTRFDLNRTKDSSGFYNPWATDTKIAYFLDRDYSYVALDNSTPYEIYTTTDLCKHYEILPETLVCDQVVKSIQAVESPQTVKQDDSINVNAVVTYLNGGTETVTCRTSFTTGTLGNNQAATLYYDGYANASDVSKDSKTTFSCTAIINVVSKRIFTGIQANLSKSNIEKNEDFPILSLTLLYSDGSSETVTSGWSIANFDKTKGGQQTVTISYIKDGITKTTQVIIFVRELDRITVSLSNNTIELNEELPIQNVTLFYNNGTTESVTTGWSIFGFDKTKGGQQIVTISYSKNGVTKTTTVVVYVRQLSNISANMSSYTIQKYNAFPIINLTLFFNDGTSKTVNSGWSISGFDNSKKGTCMVTITYTVNGASCYTYANITVTNLVKICNICGNSYYCDDNDFDPGCSYCKSTLDYIYLSNYEVNLSLGESLNINVYAVYKNGRIETVTGWNSNYNPNNMGEQIVTVTYGGFEDKLIVRISHKTICSICGNFYNLNDDGSDPGCPLCRKSISSIEVSPTTSIVFLHNNLDIVVTAVFKDGHSEIVYGWTSNFQNYRLGLQTVTITYNNVSTNIQVEVIKNQILVTCPYCGYTYDSNEYPSACPNCSSAISYISASLISEGTRVQLGSDLKLKIVVTYNDNHRELSYSGYAIQNYLKDQLGIQTILVTYKEYNCYLTIEVINSLIKVTCPNGHVYSLNEDGSDPGCPYCDDILQSTSISYVDVTFTTEILQRLYVDGYYLIPSGDYFSISIKKRNITKGILFTITHLDMLANRKKFSFGGEVL